MRKLFFTAALFFFAATSAMYAQSSPVGIWKTVDDETGEAKSHVEIYQKGNKFYGKVAKILTDNKDAVCEKCEGAKKGQSVLGLVIIEGLSAYKDYWKNGTILDPESGSEYRLSVWFEKDKPNQIQVRGKHWTGLFRTQTWYKVQ